MPTPARPPEAAGIFIRKGTSPSFTFVPAWVIGTEDHTTQLSRFVLTGKPEVIRSTTNSSLLASCRFRSWECWDHSHSRCPARTHIHRARVGSRCCWRRMALLPLKQVSPDLGSIGLRSGRVTHYSEKADVYGRLSGSGTTNALCTADSVSISGSSIDPLQSRSMKLPIIVDNGPREHALFANLQRSLDTARTLDPCATISFLCANQVPSPHNRRSPLLCGFSKAEA